MSSANILTVICRALSQAQIPYMIVGSFASNLYGPARGTHDIDVVVSATPQQTRDFLAAFPKADYYYDLETALNACRRRDMFNILDMSSGWKVDIIFLKPAAYAREAFDRRTAAEIDGVPLFAPTVEDVIISKLDWARMGGSLRQIEDVAGILKEQHELLDYVYAEKWIKELALTEQYAAALKAANLQ